MDKNFVNIDDLVRQRLGGGEERERAGSWLQMKDLLDKEMPQDKPAGIYWKRMLGVVAVGALLAGLSVGGYEVNSFVRRSVGDVHPAMADGVIAESDAMHDAGVTKSAPNHNTDNHLAANELSENTTSPASESNNNVSSTTTSLATKHNTTGNKHSQRKTINNTAANTLAANNTKADAIKEDKIAAQANNPVVANSNQTKPIATNKHADDIATPVSATSSIASNNSKLAAGTADAVASNNVKAPVVSSTGVNKPIEQGPSHEAKNANKGVTTSKNGNTNIAGAAIAANNPKVNGNNLRHNRGNIAKSAGRVETKNAPGNAQTMGTAGTQATTNEAPKVGSNKNSSGLQVLSASAPVAKAPGNAVTTAVKTTNDTKVATHKNKVVADKHETNALTTAKTVTTKATLPTQGAAVGAATQIANTTTPTLPGTGNATSVKTPVTVAVKPADEATTRNNKLAEENQRLTAARTAQINNKRNEAKLRLRALNSKLKSINNSGTAAEAPETIADNAIAGSATPAAVKPTGNNTAGGTTRSKSIMNRLPVAGKAIAANGAAGAPAAKTIAFPTGGATANNAGSMVKPNVLSSSAGAAKTMPVVGKPVAGGTIPGGAKPTGNSGANGNDVDTKGQTRGKRVIERLTILQQYVRTAPNAGYLNMDTISRETLTQEFGISAEADPAANARKSGSVLAAGSNNAQSGINKLVPTPSTISTSKTVSGSIKEMPSETSASTSQSLENLSAAFNDIKTKVGAIQFAPGLIAGINGTFFGPANFKGFHFGITGNIIFDPNWNVMVELRYFNRINNDYAMNDDYYNYTANGAGGYTKQLQTNSYSFATLHSLEMPVALRFTAGNFNFYGGGNVSYNFAVNTGAAASPTTVDPVVVSAIGTDNQPKLKAADFDARFGVGYLFGASFQAGPNVSFDFRSVQNVWDNAQTTGGKSISNELYKNPSFQISFGYRLGGNKENK